MDVESEYSGYPEEEAVVYDEKRFDHLSGKVFDALETDILKRFYSQFSKGTSILEVGCGTGRFMEIGETLGMDLTGIDMSHAMVKQTRRKVSDDASICVADGMKLPFSDNSFDGVYSIRTLNQVPSSQHALSIVQEMIRVCKMNGAILIEFVNGDAIFSRNRESCTYLTFEEIEPILLDSGGVIEHKEGILFFSQTVLETVPNIIVEPFAKIDKRLGKTFPHQSTRGYLFGSLSGADDHENRGSQA